MVDWFLAWLLLIGTAYVQSGPNRTESGDIDGGNPWRWLSLFQQLSSAEMAVMWSNMGKTQYYLSIWNPKKNSINQGSTQKSCSIRKQNTWDSPQAGHQHLEKPSRMFMLEVLTFLLLDELQRNDYFLYSFIQQILEHSRAYLVKT